MKLEITDHALARMQKRGVSQGAIESALKNEHSRKPGDGGNIVVAGYAAGRVLNVVTAPSDGFTIVVVTAWWQHQ